MGLISLHSPDGEAVAASALLPEPKASCEAALAAEYGAIDSSVGECLWVFEDLLFIIAKKPAKGKITSQFSAKLPFLRTMEVYFYIVRIQCTMGIAVILCQETMEM